MNNFAICSVFWKRSIHVLCVSRRCSTVVEWAGWIREPDVRLAEGLNSRML